MAPPLDSDLYHRDFTLSNARFILGPKAEVDIIDSRDPSGTWHAHLIKTEAGRQSHVFSEKAGDSHNALRLLHAKSALATHQHISTIGFGHPPAAAKTVRGGVASAPSDVVALCSSSSEGEDEDEDEAAPDSDDSLRNRRGRGRGREHEQRRSRFVAGEAVSGRRMRRCSGSDDANEKHSDNDDDDDGSNSDSDRPEPVVMQSPRRFPPVGWRSPGPAPSHPPPRGPLPGWVGARSPPLARVPPPPGPVMMPPPPPPRNMMPPANVGPKPPRLVPALLNISWAGRGRKNMLVQVAPSEQALRQMALTEARLRPAGFIDPAQPGVPPPPFAPTDSLSLRAVLRRVTLGGEVYEVSSFGHDLSALFRGASGVPRFDIEVFGVLVMTPRPRVNSPLSENSDDDDDGDDDDNK
ncbi:hypothetical protein AK830_g10318 [Neonectria ditissima]|uniref:Uncharacterized protein n=1 Tax=Neonectria ditissima TaxID=78410 RepID=A0A0N8H5I3_9HYPO|nr:hypothetical protein AK830_g10318 [Neonectria ditissima]